MKGNFSEKIDRQIAYLAYTKEDKEIFTIYDKFQKFAGSLMVPIVDNKAYFLFQTTDGNISEDKFLTMRVTGNIFFSYDDEKKFVTAKYFEKGFKEY